MFEVGTGDLSWWGSLTAVTSGSMGGAGVGVVGGRGERSVSGLRVPAAPFVAAGPSGVAVRDRLRHLTAEDERVLRLVGAHLGALASRDLKARCADGLEHSANRWAVRKRGLTPLSPGSVRRGN